MDAQRLDHLLERWNAGICNPEEQAELDDWFHSINHEKGALNRQIAAAGSQEALAQAMLDDFNSKRKKPRKLYAIAPLYKAAAAVLLFAAAGTWFYMSRPATQQKAPAIAQVTDKIVPGQNKAILTLSNGATIALTDAANGRLASEPGVAVNKTNDGQIAYAATGQQDNTVLYHTIDIPRGGQYQLLLPDGSKVWLNAASRLRYPVRFVGGERKVELSGEAYFEVAHNASQPFLVQSDNQVIKVLGTHFNVKAYNDEAINKTTLLEGSVQVTTGGTQVADNKQQAILRPGEQASVTRDQQRLRVAKASVDEAVAWKSGYFLFDNQDIRTIMKMVSRWYDVDVDYGAMHKEVFIGGSFSRTADLKDLLTNLEAISHTHFTIKERRIIVSN